jgi:predicted MFS family arabinose efflux permease
MPNVLSIIGATYAGADRARALGAYGLVMGLAAVVRVRAASAAPGQCSGAPLLAPRLFQRRSVSAGLVTQLALWCGQASFFLVLALYLQQRRGMSALHAGLVFTILAVAYVATSAQAPALNERYGRRLLAIGALVLAVGHGLLLEPQPARARPERRCVRPSRELPRDRARATEPGDGASPR